MEVVAPPGRLGLFFGQDEDGAHVIRHVRASSPLHVAVGDRISRVRTRQTGVTTTDTFSRDHVTALLTALSDEERALVLTRESESTLLDSARVYARRVSKRLSATASEGAYVLLDALARKLEGAEAGTAPPDTVATQASMPKAVQPREPLPPEVVALGDSVVEDDAGPGPVDRRLSLIHI